MTSSQTNFWKSHYHVKIWREIFDVDMHILTQSVDSNQQNSSMTGFIFLKVINLDSKGRLIKLDDQGNRIMVDGDDGTYYTLQNPRVGSQLKIVFVNHIVLNKFQAAFAC